MVNSFLSALSFYTRIPVPAKVHHSPEILDKGTKFLPLIGAVVGGMGALVYYLSALVFSDATAIIFSMAGTVLITGAFHEDGFSDTCDGLGGGWTVEKKLEIMKDSRVGAFGLIGTVLMLLCKWVLLQELPPHFLVSGIIIGHVLSRLVPVWLIRLLPYVRLDETSKAKPIAKKISVWGILFAALSAAVIVVLLEYQAVWLFSLYLVLVPLFVVFYRRQLGGYTGDLLGASQQLSEIAVLAGAAVLWNCIL